MFLLKKILFFSDSHGAPKKAKKLIGEEGFDMVLFGGDGVEDIIDVADNSFVICFGNHEPLWGVHPSRTPREHLQFRQNPGGLCVGVIHGNLAERKRKPNHHTAEGLEVMIDRIVFHRPDILLTHEPVGWFPLGRTLSMELPRIPEPLNLYRKIVDAKIPLICSGHVHAEYCYRLKDTWFLGAGYGFRSAWIVEWEGRIKGLELRRL